MRCSRGWSVLRDSDPVGGDPDALQKLADRCADTAAAMERGAWALRTVHDSSTTWESDAGRAFQQRTVEVATALGRAQPRYAATALALTHYRVWLQQLQDEADTILSRAWLAHDESRSADYARWVASDPAAKLYWGERAEQAEAELRRADRSLDVVETSWHRAGQQAAEALEEATDADGLDDSLRERVVDAGLDVVADLSKEAATASAVLGVASVVLLAVTAVVPLAGAVLVPAAGVLGSASFALGGLAIAGGAVLVVAGRKTAGELFFEILWAGVGRVVPGLGRLRGGAASSSGAGRTLPGPPLGGSPRGVAPPSLAGETAGVAVPEASQRVIDRATARDRQRARRSAEERARDREVERQADLADAAPSCPR